MTYSLTEKMDELGPILVGLNRIAEKWYGMEPSEGPPCPGRIEDRPTDD